MNTPGSLSSNFRENFYSLAPPWLTTGNAEKYLYTLQLCSDLLLDKMSQASLIGMPGLGDPSQIPWLANDRVLFQGPAESDAAFITRLQTAFPAWKKAGSRVSVLGQLQAYLQNLQPGVTPALPEMTIVSGNSSVTTWDTIYQDTPIGAQPAHTTVAANWDWDGKYLPWRTWLVLFMALVPTGLSGSSAATGTTAGIAYGTGANVNGVWVPNSGATPINEPYLNLTGLSGLTAANAGQWITISGSSNPGNNGTFPILTVTTSTECTIANPNGVGSDAGPLTWSIGSYPFIGPGPTWGAPGVLFGQGELQIPALDFGSNVHGIWQPTSSTNYGPSISFGLSCSAQVIQSIRQIVGSKTAGWKSAGAYYESIIIAFDGATGAAGSAFSPNSSEGSGNPDGSFGGHGKNVAGVWIPNRLITSTFDCYCQGTGSWQGSSVEYT
jgi:hypothetical protein